MFSSIAFVRDHFKLPMSVNNSVSQIEYISYKLQIQYIEIVAGPVYMSPRLKEKKNIAQMMDGSAFVSHQNHTEIDL